MLTKKIERYLRLAKTRKQIDRNPCTSYTKLVTTFDSQINDIETMNKNTKTERYIQMYRKKISYHHHILISAM